MRRRAILDGATDGRCLWIPLVSSKHLSGPIRRDPTMVLGDSDDRRSGQPVGILRNWNTERPVTACQVAWGARSAMPGTGPPLPSVTTTSPPTTSAATSAVAMFSRMLGQPWIVLIVIEIEGPSVMRPKGMLSGPCRALTTRRLPVTPRLSPLARAAPRPDRPMTASIIRFPLLRYRRPA